MALTSLHGRRLHGGLLRASIAALCRPESAVLKSCLSVHFVETKGLYFSRCFAATMLSIAALRWVVILVGVPKAWAF